MKRFQVLVHGSNLVLLKNEGADGKHLGGVYVWRGVEADSEEAALAGAVAALTQEPEFQAEVWNTPENPPKFEADEVRLVGPGVASECDGGYVFYAEDDE